MSKNKYYRILGLAPDASQDDVRRAYRKMVMKYHPDKNPSPTAEAKFIQIKEAYEVLTGKVEEKVVRVRSTSTEQEKKEEKEARVKEAQKRYEEQQYRSFMDNELYYQRLTTGFRWKLMKISAIFGIILNLMFIADYFLPHHYEEDRVSQYNINPAKGTDGKDISLIVTEKGERYWINNISFALYTVDPDIFVERSWFFHNSINLISVIDLKYRFYKIDFNYYRHAWLFMLVFFVPLFTVLYKRRSTSFTVIYHFAYYISNTMMIVFILTGDRWAHILTLGFF